MTNYYVAVVPSAAKRKTKVHTSTSSDITGRALSLCGHEVQPTGVPMLTLWTQPNTEYDLFCKRCSSLWLDAVPMQTLHEINDTFNDQRDLQSNAERGTIQS